MDGRSIGRITAAELGRMIGRGEVSSTEAVNSYLERVDRLNGRLGGMTLVAREEALGEATEREKELASGLSRGPLHGVPVGIKEQIDVRGWPTTGGSAILREAVAERDATVTSRLREAGAIILGKLNMTELAIAETIEFPYGTPLNPWNPDRSPRLVKRRLRNGYGCFPVRSNPWRRHGRLDPNSRRLLRHRWPQANVRARQPCRCPSRVLVDGHDRADDPHG